MKKEINYKYKSLNCKMKIYDQIIEIDETTLLKAYGNLAFGIFLIFFSVAFLVD